MGFAESMRILSGINCGLSSGATYVNQINNGVPKGVALGNLFGNISNGLMRNEVAYNMQRWGNSWGNMINMYAGYGNPYSNAIGTLGLLGACNPWMFFRQSMFGCGGFGMMGMGYPGFGMGMMGFGMSPFGGSIKITTTRTGFGPFMGCFC